MESSNSWNGYLQWCIEMRHCTFSWNRLDTENRFIILKLVKLFTGQFKLQAEKVKHSCIYLGLRCFIGKIESEKKQNNVWGISSSILVAARRSLLTGGVSARRVSISRPAARRERRLIHLRWPPLGFSIFFCWAAETQFLNGHGKAFKIEFFPFQFVQWVTTTFLKSILA